MKKIFSSILCFAMLLSMGTVAFADNYLSGGGDISVSKNNTIVEYSADENFMIIIPAEINFEGDSAEATISGIACLEPNSLLTVSVESPNFSERDNEWFLINTQNAYVKMPYLIQNSKNAMNNDISSGDIFLTIEPSNTYTQASDFTKTLYLWRPYIESVAGTFRDTLTFTAQITEKELVSGAYLGNQLLSSFRGAENIIENDYVDGEAGHEQGMMFIVDVEAPNATKLVFDSNVTKIGNYAFANATGITELDMANTITSIGDGAFEYAGLVDVVIPESVNHIGSNAFGSIANLRSVTILSDDIELGDGIFNTSAGMNTVTLSVGVKKISANTFFCCSSLKTINYMGTEEQWNAIVKEEGWDTNRMSDYDLTINFNYQIS